MLFKPHPKHIGQALRSPYPRPLIGDWLVILASSILIILMFQAFWSFMPASKLRIRQGNQVVGTYDLNQDKIIHLHGKIGESVIHIHEGKARFQSSPCNNQYCVHQGWLSHSGQVAICLPNQISLQLTGAKTDFDSLNY